MNTYLQWSIYKDNKLNRNSFCRESENAHLQPNRGNVFEFRLINNCDPFHISNTALATLRLHNIITTRILQNPRPSQQLDINSIHPRIRRLHQILVSVNSYSNYSIFYEYYLWKRIKKILERKKNGKKINLSPNIIETR